MLRGITKYMGMQMVFWWYDFFYIQEKFLIWNVNNSSKKYLMPNQQFPYTQVNLYYLKNSSTIVSYTG